MAAAFVESRRVADEECLTQIHSAVTKYYRQNTSIVFLITEHTVQPPLKPEFGLIIHLPPHRKHSECALRGPTG
jgi:hypothetical protein